MFAKAIFLVVLAAIVVAATLTVDFVRKPSSTSVQPSTKVVASRYPLRKRTPGFFERSKVSYARTRG